MWGYITIISLFGAFIFAMLYSSYVYDNDIFIIDGFWNDDMKKNIIAVCLLIAFIACNILELVGICILSNQ